jgi:integrase
MAARMEKTRHPGIYRRGGRYVVVFRDGDGAQRKQSARTLDEARRLKSAREADVARGEFHEQARVRFREYAEEWVERYQGKRGSLRESTREEYRRDLRLYAFPFFDEQRRRTLAQITPRDASDYVGWLCRQTTRGGNPLSDGKVTNAVKVVRVCLGTAVREELLRHNPVRDVVLPRRENVEDVEQDEVRVLRAEQLEAFLAVVKPRYRLMFCFLAATGLRLSELLALQWRHLALDGSRPHVKIRRAYVRGRMHPPKTRHGRREIPLDVELVSALRRLRRQTEWPGDEHLVFPSRSGTPIQASNIRRRVLDPVAEEIGAP